MGERLRVLGRVLAARNICPSQRAQQKRERRAVSVEALLAVVQDLDLNVHAAPAIAGSNCGACMRARPANAGSSLVCASGIKDPDRIKRAGGVDDM
jgi:hypothetical protein